MESDGNGQSYRALELLLRSRGPTLHERMDEEAGQRAPLGGGHHRPVLLCHERAGMAKLRRTAMTMRGAGRAACEGEGAGEITGFQFL